MVRAVMVFAIFAVAAETSAATTRVTSLSQLQSAISGAGPGDTILLANGSYSSSAAITVTRQGTSSARITIAAETIGGATISGTAGFAVNSPAAYVTIRGFRFTHGGGGLKVASGTQHCLITRNYFVISGSGSYLRVAGSDHEVSYNSFQNKTTSGSFIVLDEDNITFRPYVHHNYLRSHTYTGSNGGEALQIFSVLPRVEWNLLEEIHVNGEFVSVKESGGSQGGFYKYNTFRNCSNGTFTLRYARNDQVEGNFFLNTPGIRVYGKLHRIRNNYLEGGTINLGDGTTTGTYIGIDDLEVSHNTLVNARLTGSSRTDGVAPRNLRIANNIIQVDGGEAVNQPHAFVNATFEGNILWGSAVAGDIPSSGYRRVDPQLVRNSNGIYHLGGSSPAIDSAAGSYPGVVEDLDGQPRSGAKDVGADEVSSAAVTRFALSPSDVGPLAGTGPTPTPTTTPTATPAMPTPTPTPTSTPCSGCTFIEITPPASSVSDSGNDGNLPGNTVDNNLASRWSSNGDGQWIRFDLGTVRTVAHVSLAVYNGNGRQNRFDLQVSSDGTTWTNAIAGGSTSGTTTLEETHDFPDVDARYVRYLGHGSTVGTFNSLTEVSLFAPASVVPTATPTPTPASTPTPTATPSPSGPAKLPVPGSAVTASTHDGNLPANTVDGSLATRWSANGDPQWIQYDLGSTKTVESLRIAWYNGNLRATTFDVLVGDAAAGPWTTIVSDRQSSGTTTALETYDVTDVAGRYVRIVGHGNSLNLWNSVTETEVWGR